MALVKFLIVDGVKETRKDSSALSPDFSQIRIGASNLPIQESSGNLAFGSVKLTAVADPTNPQDAATKAYADGIAAGLDPKASCRLATTANIASILTANQATVEAALDQISAAAPTLVSGNRILVKDQSTASENGIYTWNGSALVRATDFDGTPANEVSGGAHTYIEAGDLYSGAGYVVIWDGNVTVGTNPINWSQFSGGGSLIAGAGISKTGNQIDIELATDPGLEFDAGGVAGKIRAKVNPSGAIERVAAGLGVKVEASNPSLQISGNELGVKFDAAGALEKVAGGVKVKIEASNPSLQISGNELGVKFDAAGALEKGASGVKARVDGSTLKIASNNLAVDHSLTKTNDNAGSITVGQIVYVKPNFNVDLARADVSGLEDAILGIVEDATIATTASGKIFFRRGAIVGGFTGLTSGKVYVSRTTAGAYTQDISSFVATEKVYSVGRAISATEIVYDPQFEYLIG